MKRNLIGIILGIGLIFVVAGDAFSQGRGRGGGNSGGGGRGNSGNVTRGNSNDDRIRSTQKRNDDSSNRGNSKNDRTNNSISKNNRYNGLSRKTGMSSQSLQKWYESERELNPDLTYGQFVAANMIARNHGLSAQTILDGLRGGDSIGQVLRGSGWNDKKIKKERKRIKNNLEDDDLDYRDRDLDWRF